MPEEELMHVRLTAINVYDCNPEIMHGEVVGIQDTTITVEWAWQDLMNPLVTCYERVKLSKAEFEQALRVTQTFTPEQRRVPWLK